jgi:hypothetical protein
MFRMDTDAINSKVFNCKLSVFFKLNSNRELLFRGIFIKNELFLSWRFINRGSPVIAGNTPDYTKSQIQSNFFKKKLAIDYLRSLYKFRNYWVWFPLKIKTTRLDQALESVLSKRDSRICLLPLTRK